MEYAFLSGQKELEINAGYLTQRRQLVNYEIFKAIKNNHTHYYQKPKFVLKKMRHCQLATTCFGIPGSRKKEGKRIDIH